MKTSNLNNRKQVKTSLVAFQQLTDLFSKEAKEKGIKEKNLLEDIEQAREEMWNERKP